jgi:hypothetical protein
VPLPPSTFAYSTERIRATRVSHVFSSLTVQLTTLMFLVAMVLWAALFTSYAPVHDSLHALRHALFLIPCH